MGTRGYYPDQGAREIDEEVLRMQTELFGDVARGKPLTGREDITHVLAQGHPAFGGQLLRKAYQLMRTAIGEDYTLFVSVAGPITASDYSRVWFNPFMEKGYISAFSASDAISYHDIHDPVEGKRRIHEVDINADDVKLRDAQIIRITNIGFPEEILFNTDRFVSWVLQQPEFQKRMTTTEFRNTLGTYVLALEREKEVSPGLLSTAFQYDVPGFCASPADGSVFLNLMKLKMMQDRLGEGLDRKVETEIDLAKDVYEFCAYHLWCQHHEGNNKIGYFVFGGGAVKNYLLQPEPALEQILFVPTDKYNIGVQFTTAPVTDGSLSSCFPSEAISWGKLSKEAMTVSVPVDYTMVMSTLAYAILRERCLYEDALNSNYNGDREKLFSAVPQAKGFLREPRRLYTKREQAMEFLDEQLRKNIVKIRGSLDFSG